MIKNDEYKRRGKLFGEIWSFIRKANNVQAEKMYQQKYAGTNIFIFGIDEEIDAYDLSTFNYFNAMGCCGTIEIFRVGEYDEILNPAYRRGIYLDDSNIGLFVRRHLEEDEEFYVKVKEYYNEQLIKAIGE